MESSPEPTEPDQHGLPPSAVLAGSYPHRAAAFEHSLVVLAMRAPCWIIPSGDAHHLYVEQERLPLLAKELAAYDEEAQYWNSRPGAGPEYPPSFYLPYLGALLLAIAFVYQSQRAPHWVEWGAADSQRMTRDGEWWRALTALFLHADWAHVLSNIVFGWWYGALVARGFGNLRGWALILLSGVMANVLGAFITQAQSRSAIGFSTAVFGALGLLVAHGLVVHRAARHGSLLRQLAPLLAGGMLFSITAGIGDAGVDWLGHALGAVCGLGLGLGFARRPESAARRVL